MAILVRALAEEGIRPIVVGGHAVAFYTLGGYATGDIDLIVADSEPPSRLLIAWGFKREGRHWYSEELDIAFRVSGFSPGQGCHKGQQGIYAPCPQEYLTPGS